MEKRKLSAKTIAMLAMMVALALVLSYVESLIPINFGIPGVKLGLANLVTVVTLYVMGPRQALVVSVIRIVLSGVLFGNMAAILYSLAGGLLSLAVMILIKKWGRVSAVTVSVIGGICHNVGQLVVAVLVVESLKIAFYLPVLLIAGFLTGLLIGVVSKIVISRIRPILFGGKQG